MNDAHDTTDGRIAHDHCRCRLGRRRFLAAAGVAGVSALAGCSGGGSPAGDAPDPVSLGGGKQCDSCGMVIAEHAGPNGQIFYREHGPSTHDNPAWFDSLKGCLFPYYFEHERLDWEASAVYVTDYSTVEYEVTTTEGREYISTATAAEAFANAEDVTFVVGSDVHGAMGPDFVPFSRSEDADAFVEEYGGRTVTIDDVTPKLLSR